MGIPPTTASGARQATPTGRSVLMATSSTPCGTWCREKWTKSQGWSRWSQTAIARLRPELFLFGAALVQNIEPSKASKYLEGARTTGQAPAVYSASCEHCFLWQLVSAFAYQA